MADAPDILTSAAPATSSGAAARPKRISRPRFVALILFVVLVCAAALSGPLLSAPQRQRIADGWSWQANYVGQSAVPDANTGTFGESAPSIYRRTMTASGAGSVAGSVKVVDDYVIVDPATRETVWRYTIYPSVEAKTGKRAEPEYRDHYYVFPRNVERKTYTLRQSYLKGVPMRFVAEDTIEGLPVYVFEHAGRGEYTESYAGSAEYPGIAVEPGQEIKCADDQFFLRMWVEPVTGETVKIDEGCESGDYIYEVATGRQIAPVLLWSGQTEGTDVVTRIEKIRSDRFRMFVADYLPLGLAVLAVLLGVVLLINRRTQA